MQVSEIKQQLHRPIDTIKDETCLQTLITILAAKKEIPEEGVLINEQFQLLREREEKQKGGKSKAVSLNEYNNEINRELRVK